MLNRKFKFAFSLIITVILTLGFSISFQNILAAWQEPTAAAPASNLLPPVYNEFTPLDTSNVLINKQLGITGSLSLTDGNLIVNTGNVGIGMTNPTQKLDVNGTIRATGDICTDVGGGKCLGDSSDIPAHAVMAFNLATCPTGWTALPGANGRVIVGRDTSDTSFDTIGESGGEKAHILTREEMPSHSHNIYSRQVGAGNDHYDAVSHGYTEGNRFENTNGLVAPSGDGVAHNNLQPYYVLLYCQKN